MRTLSSLLLAVFSLSLSLLLLPKAAAQVTIINNNNQPATFTVTTNPYSYVPQSPNIPQNPYYTPWYTYPVTTFNPFVYPHPYGYAYGDCSAYGPGAFFNTNAGRCEYWPIPVGYRTISYAPSYPWTCTGEYRSYPDQRRRVRECFCEPGERWSAREGRCTDNTTYCASIDRRARWDASVQACQCMSGYRADDTGHHCVSNAYGPRTYTRYIFE